MVFPEYRDSLEVFGAESLLDESFKRSTGGYSIIL